MGEGRDEQIIDCLACRELTLWSVAFGGLDEESLPADLGDVSAVDIVTIERLVDTRGRIESAQSGGKKDLVLHCSLGL